MSDEAKKVYREKFDGNVNIKKIVKVYRSVNINKLK